MAEDWMDKAKGWSDSCHKVKQKETTAGSPQFWYALGIFCYCSFYFLPFLFNELMFLVTLGKILNSLSFCCCFFLNEGRGVYAVEEGSGL